MNQGGSLPVFRHHNWHRLQRGPRAVVSSCQRILEDEEIATWVWEESSSQADASKQWVKGPFTADVFSQYWINSSVSCHEQKDLEGIDHICATARFFMGAVDQGGNVLDCGGERTWVNSQAPPSWSSSLLGR